MELSGDSHKQETKNSIMNLISKYVQYVDMLFIDGDHSYYGVMEDFYSYSAFVRSEGWIVFHDIRDTEYHRNLPPPDGPVEVFKFWNMIKNKYESWEILDPDDSTYMGIGVIRL
jgi:hypothetical protein